MKGDEATLGLVALSVEPTKPLSLENCIPRVLVEPNLAGFSPAAQLWELGMWWDQSIPWIKTQVTNTPTKNLGGSVKRPVQHGLLPAAQPSPSPAAWFRHAFWGKKGQSGGVLGGGRAVSYPAAV